MTPDAHRRVDYTMVASDTLDAMRARRRAAHAAGASDRIVPSVARDRCASGSVAKTSGARRWDQFIPQPNAHKEHCIMNIPTRKVLATIMLAMAATATGAQAADPHAYFEQQRQLTDGSFPSYTIIPKPAAANQPAANGNGEAKHAESPAGKLAFRRVAQLFEGEVCLEPVGGKKPADKQFEFFLKELTRQSGG